MRVAGCADGAARRTEGQERCVRCAAGAAGISVSAAAAHRWRRRRAELIKVATVENGFQITRRLIRRMRLGIAVRSNKLWQRMQ